MVKAYAACLVNDIVSYLNQTLRELHSRPDNGAAILYPENREEIQLTADLETGFSWRTNQTRFQMLETVRYDSIIDENQDPIYPVITIPGRNMNQHIYYVYRAGAFYHFIGYGGIDAKISISYFSLSHIL